MPRLTHPAAPLPLTGGNGREADTYKNLQQSKKRGDAKNIKGDIISVKRHAKYLDHAVLTHLEELISNKQMENVTINL